MPYPLIRGMALEKVPDKGGYSYRVSIIGRRSPLQQAPLFLGIDHVSYDLADYGGIGCGHTISTLTASHHGVLALMVVWLGADPCSSA
jgi:hypothetical protein